MGRSYDSAISRPWAAPTQACNNRGLESVEVSSNILAIIVGASAVLWLLSRVPARLRLSRAKHPSLAGHARIARQIARFVPFYEYDEADVFDCDGASADLAGQRRHAFFELAHRLAAAGPASLAATRALEPAVSDLQLTNLNRVPFQFRSLVRRHLPLAAFADASSGTQIRNPDGRWAYDLGGSYGVNLLGYEWYKSNIAAAVDAASELGPVLGPYHPLIVENVRAIRALSGQDEVSFHMSGTEAVMQAVRLARFNTRRPKLVMFCGAYHGWWDGVQAGVGHQRTVDDILLLSDMSERSLDVLRTRRDIACVLINPLQALHPNAGPGSDAMLVAGGRRAGFDRDSYSDWLTRLREVCSARRIALVFDEVFLGFRLGPGGAQEYFGVRADMVTYGKTIGGGLPVGVVAGKSWLMKRYRENRPTDLCLARGTFNSHPYVMAAMNGFLKRVTAPEWRHEAAAQIDMWDERAATLNRQLSSLNLPITIHSLASVWLIAYTKTGRFHWLFQYYLRAERLSLSWVGTGRLIFSHDYTDEDFSAVAERIIAAAQKMRDGAWWTPVPGLDERAVRKRVLREMLGACFGQRTVGSSSGSLTPDSSSSTPRLDSRPLP